MVTVHLLSVMDLSRDADSSNMGISLAPMSFRQLSDRRI